MAEYKNDYQLFLNFPPQRVLNLGHLGTVRGLRLWNFHFKADLLAWKWPRTSFAAGGHQALQSSPALVCDSILEWCARRWKQVAATAPDAPLTVVCGRLLKAIIHAAVFTHKNLIRMIQNFHDRFELVYWIFYIAQISWNVQWLHVECQQN